VLGALVVLMPSLVHASFSFSSSKLSGFTLGVGPAVSLPSTSEPTLGTGKWCVVLLPRQR
jgi:hypothetical protein